MTRQWENYSDATPVDMAQLGEVRPEDQLVVSVLGRPIVALVITPPTPGVAGEVRRITYLLPAPVAASLHGQLDAWRDAMPMGAYEQYDEIRTATWLKAREALGS